MTTAALSGGQPTVDGEVGEEAALVRRARLDPAAFGELYERYVSLVYRLIESRVSSREAAEELTAETFRRVLQGIDHYRPSGRPFGAWLCRIATMTTADYLDARRPEAGVGDGDGRDRPRPEVARVRAALETLDEAQRTAITLKLGQDMRVADIAAHMGESEETVRLLIRGGLATLRQRLDT